MELKKIKVNCLLFVSFSVLLFFTNTGCSQDSLIYEDYLNNHRIEKAAEFKNPDSSPLTSKQIKGFSDLEYFPADKNYKIEGIFTHLKGQKSFKMKTSTDRLPEYLKYGEILAWFCNPVLFLLFVH